MADIRVHPLANSYNLQREFNRFFDTLFPSTDKNEATQAPTAVWRPTVDVHEDAEGYVVDLELPGLTRENVKINYQDGALSITGERRYEYDAKGENGEKKDRTCHRMERSYGRFHRTFNFPQAVDAEKISARFDNGVLRVTVPKAETLKPRQIDIQ